MVIKRRRKRKKSLGKQLIIISSILLINFTGVTYAAWNGGINLNNKIDMGEMKPVFCPAEGVNEYLDIDIIDDNTIEIEGKVAPDFEGSIYYRVANNGTLPIKYNDSSDGVKYKSGNELNLQLNQQSSIIYPDTYSFNENKGESNLQIQAKDPGVYEFEIDLLFDQWTK